MLAENETTPANRDCPVCGSLRNSLTLQKNDLRLVQCAGCSMIFANPAPGNYASGTYYQQIGSDFYLSPAKLEGDYSDARFQRELSFFRARCPKGSILDVGCSSGAFLFHLARLFPGDYQALGTDVSGAPLDYAESRGIRVARGDFLTKDFSGERFDAVTFWAVLEHLMEPRKFLARAKALLNPNGTCFVLVPNMQSLAAHLLGARYRYIYPQHLNYFTRRTLEQLLKPEFSILDVRFTHFNPVVILQDWRGGGRDVSNAERAELLRRTTRYKTSRAMAIPRLAYKLLERVLGRLALADNIMVAAQKI